MNEDTLTLPLTPDFIGHLQARLWREFAAAVEDWSRCVTALTRWEDEHLLDNPSAEKLAQHKQTIERLLRFGQFLSLVTQQSEYSDQPLAEIVTSTQRCLRDKLTMWHGAKMSAERKVEILKATFNES